jgi:hypothetical protein
MTIFFCGTLEKFQMHWLGPYVITFVTEAGVVQLEKLNGESMEGMVNDSQLRLYNDSHASVHYPVLRAKHQYSIEEPQENYSTP